MDTLSAIISQISEVAAFSPEYEGENVFALIQESYEELLARYPLLKRYSDYLAFLRRTGGAHIHNRDFSLGIYGFSGYVVTSFGEGNFLDQGRYFQFGEVLYPERQDLSFVLAFDFESVHDVVLLSPIEASQYRVCSPSFIRLLVDFSEGKYPGLKV